MNPTNSNSFHRYPSIVGIALILLLCCPLSSAGNQNALTILVFGDSLSAGYGIKKEESWAYLLQQKLEQEAVFHDLRVNVVNASISGETSAGGLSRLEATLERVKPDILILALGANDGLRGFPVKLIEQNLEKMISMAKTRNIGILLCGIQIPLNYGPRYTRLFEKMYLNIASQNSLPFLPSLLGNIPLDTNLMQADLLHPNAQAQPLILELLFPALEPLIAEQIKAPLHPQPASINPQP
ncbi:MAG: arylesterase [Pseudomonadales bacterium]|nr:arylesterase [Pseudomonadales bacterium]